MSDPAQVLAALLQLEQAQAVAKNARITIESAVDNGWMLITSTLIFFMQVGFTSLEAGSVAWKRSVPEIIIKNVVTTVISCIVWWLVGYGIAFGTGNGFLGETYYAKTTQGLVVRSESFAFWVFQWTFCSISAAIVSGSVAERSRLTSYMIFTVIMCSLIYPIIAHWCWSTAGWLSAFRPDGNFVIGNNYLDFAGSGVVHMTGGFAALLMAYFIGPRKNRFTDSWKKRGISLFNSQDPGWVALGTFFLWFGWYGFNGGSTLQLTNNVWAVSSLVFANTTISGCFGGIVCMVWSKFLDKRWDIGKVCNGVLAGLVSITAPCAYVETWAAVIIGIVGGTIFYWSARGLVHFRIDDPVDAAPLHLGCGTWGVFSLGLFATQHHTHNVLGRSTYYGAFMGGGGEQLAAQIIGILVILGWTGLFAGLFAFVSKKLGLLRMSLQKEEKYYEEHLLANKAEEGFSSVVTYNKKKGEGKSLEDLEISGEALGDLSSGGGDSNHSNDLDKEIGGDKKSETASPKASEKQSTTHSESSSIKKTSAPEKKKPEVASGSAEVSSKKASSSSAGSSHNTKTSSASLSSEGNKSSASASS